MSLKLITLQQQVPEAVRLLYEDSFPITEKRPWHRQLMLIGQHKLSVASIHWDDVFMGLLIYWQLRGFIFIEYFAVTPDARGNGIGSSVIKEMQRLHPVIILESEPAGAGVMAIRRLGFYEKLGFAIFPFAYYQPPYIPDGDFLPMTLMQYGTTTTEQVFREVKQTIYREVYEL